MFPQLGVMEMIVVMGVAVLLFGKRLPEVGRSLGKGIIEFKKGLRGLEEGFDITSPDISSHTSRRSSVDDRPRDSSYPKEFSDAAVPKFEPPASTPATAPAPQMEYTAPPAPKD
jgi:sec-independent protein translocase protein TatA